MNDVSLVTKLINIFFTISSQTFMWGENIEEEMLKGTEGSGVTSTKLKEGSHSQ